MKLFKRKKETTEPVSSIESALSGLQDAAKKAVENQEKAEASVPAQTEQPKTTAPVETKPVKEEVSDKKKEPEVTKKDSPYKLVVDGDWGKKTILTTQHILGCKEDGLMGQETIKAIQKKVGAAADGNWGTQTSKAMQKFLGVTVDGLRGPETVKAWQKWCNSQLN